MFKNQATGAGGGQQRPPTDQAAKKQPANKPAPKPK